MLLPRNLSSKLPEYLMFIVLFWSLVTGWYLGNSELKLNRKEITKKQDTAAWLLKEMINKMPTELSIDTLKVPSYERLTLQRVMKQARDNLNCPVYLIDMRGQLILTDSYGGPLKTREGRQLKYIPAMAKAIEQLTSGKNQAHYIGNDGTHQLRVLTSNISNTLAVGDTYIPNWFSRSVFPAYSLIIWGSILASILRYLARKSLHQWRKQSLAQTIIDPLTTLPNRKGFALLSNVFYRESKENLTPLSLMLINLDNFTHLNLAYGTEAGDAVLKQVASYLRNLVRSPNIVCRWDGDEFIVMLKNHDPYSVCHLAKYIQDYILQREIHLSGETVSLKLRIGIHSPSNNDNLHSLLSGAIHALNLARDTDESCIIYPSGNSPW
jgi:diguanylate cyclase (GGDEF)-like protein